MPKSYPVITSKTADNHYNDIVAQHENLVQGLVNQSAKVSMYRQQKATELAAQQAMAGEMQKARMTADSQTQKNAMDFAAKQGELDIRRAELSAI